jgi:ElaB/YqjD/DUF883 family membrane-anchored ribosome-binding protein
MDRIEPTESKQKIREALDLLYFAAEEGREDLRELAGESYEELCAVLGDARDGISDGAGRLAALRERGSERVREIAGGVDRYAHEAPWRVVATAAACGLVAGLLFNRMRD